MYDEKIVSIQSESKTKRGLGVWVLYERGRDTEVTFRVGSQC